MKELILREFIICFVSPHLDPHLSVYCLAVTSGILVHPPTLCAAQSVLTTHSRPMKRSGYTKEHQHRGVPEGLHCINQTRLTFHGMKYNTTYDFTLYVVCILHSLILFFNYMWTRVCHF